MARRKGAKDHARSKQATASRAAGASGGHVVGVPPSPLPTQAFSWRYGPPCVLVIVLAVFAAFRPALINELVYWDDDTNLMENTFIRDLSAGNLHKMWTEQVLGVWQPLTWMITALQYKLFDGANHATLSRGMHAVNIGLHALASVLVFLVLRRILAVAATEHAERSPAALNLGAAAAALFFAVHPLRVEIVAWASGQPYILAFIPALAAVWCYLKAQQTGRWRWQGAALVCLTTALVCKSSAVPLVAVLLVLDVYPLRRLAGERGRTWAALRRVAVEKVPYAVLTVGAAAITIWATASNKTYRPEPLVTKTLISGFCAVFYPALTFMPLGVAPYYMKPTPFDNADPRFVAATLACFVLTALLIVFRRRLPWLLAAWASYLILISPNLGVIKHGGQLAADRYTYMSCLPWAALIGAGFMRLWTTGPADRPSRTARIGSLLVMAVWLIGLGCLTAPYCRIWKDSVSVWDAMVERNPKYHMGFYNLAKAYKRPADAIWGRKNRSDDAATGEELARARELFSQAEQSYRSAIELYPSYPEANVDLGNMMKDGKAAGGAEGAMERYQAALSGRPGFHMALSNLAGLLEAAGRNEEAERHLEAALIDAQKSGEHKRLPSIQASLTRVRAKLNK